MPTGVRSSGSIDFSRTDILYMVATVHFFFCEYVSMFLWHTCMSVGAWINVGMNIYMYLCMLVRATDVRMCVSIRRYEHTCTICIQYICTL